MPLDTYGRLELLGHRTLLGRLSEEEIAGTQFIRIDVVGRDEAVETQYYGTQSVYCITPLTEAQVIEASKPRLREIAVRAEYDLYDDDRDDIGL